MQTTKNTLLGGKVPIFQPQKGYRVAIDPVLLAAAVGLVPDMRVLDLGIGTGAVSLCLKTREPQCRITGLDINSEYLNLARSSFAENGWEAEWVEGDVANPPASLAEGSFDAVVANPPYHDGGSYSPSPEKGKSQAHAGNAVSLESWVAAARRFLTSAGTFYMIFPADKETSLRLTLEGYFHEIRLFRLFQRAGGPLKRIIAAATGQKQGPSAFLEVGNMEIHQTNGDYTPEARAVLWDGDTLPII